jgi:hypothetical protein
MLGGWLRCRELPGICVCEGLEPADGDDLVLCPDPDGEGADSKQMFEDCKNNGAIQ